MGTRIYVGNLSYDTQEQGLRQFFEGGGCTVTDLHIVTDRDTGRSRGFAFVEVGDDAQLQRAIQELDGKELDGRRVSVSEARPRKPREGGGGPPGPRRGGNGAPRRGGGRPEPIVARARSPRPPRDVAPSFDGPPHMDAGPPTDPFGDPLGKDPGRRRNKKKKRRHEPEDDEPGGGGGGRGGKRRGGGKRNRFDDDW